MISINGKRIHNTVSPSLLANFPRGHVILLHPPCHSRNLYYLLLFSFFFFQTFVAIDPQLLCLIFTVETGKQLHEAEIIDNAPQPELFVLSVETHPFFWKASARQTVKGVCQSFLRYPARGRCIKQVPISGREAWTSKVTRWHHSVPVFSAKCHTN